MLSPERANAARRQARPICVVDAPRRRAEGNLEASAGDSLFRRKIPCSDKQNSLFSEEQGIRCKPLNLFGDRRQKPLKETGMGLSFPRIPC
jgi:hypothetical protein